MADSSNTRLDAAFDEWFRARAAEHSELHGNAVSREMYEAVRRAFQAGADAVESSESVRLAEALRALKDAAKQIDFARPGQLTAEEGWALIHADDEAFEALAAFDARRADQ